MQPIVLDDPTTIPPEDFWLHPCDCIPDKWGNHKPVDSAAFGSVPKVYGPAAVYNRYVPAPFVLVYGQITCQQEYLMDKHVLYVSEDTGVAPNFCRDHCQAQGCSYFFEGVQHGTSICRLYTDCDLLVSEYGIYGRLYAMASVQACRVSNPDSCWATSLRRQWLTRGTYTPASSSNYYYLHLHEQGDQLLIMGGAGVEMCSRPTYRHIISHQWAHKGPLPEIMAHGAGLQVSCWGERFRGFSKATGLQVDSQMVQCVNGVWFAQPSAELWDTSKEYPAPDMNCVPSVQVASTGYSAWLAQEQQELYWFQRTRSIVLADLEVPQCWSPQGSTIDLINYDTTTCEPFMIESAPLAAPTLRRLCKLGEHGGRDCITETESVAGAFTLAVGPAANPEKFEEVAAQLFPAEGIAQAMWNMEAVRHSTAAADSWACSGVQCRLTGSAKCGTNGALGAVDFLGSKSVCKFVPEINVKDISASFSGEVSVSFCEKPHGVSAGAFTFANAVSEYTNTYGYDKEDELFKYGGDTGVYYFRELKLDLPAALFLKWLDPKCELKINGQVIAGTESKNSNSIRRNSKAFTMSSVNRTEKGWVGVDNSLTNYNKACTGTILKTEYIEVAEGSGKCQAMCKDTSGCTAYNYRNTGGSSSLLQVPPGNFGSFNLLGRGFCSDDEKTGGRRIGDWVYGKIQADAEEECKANDQCKGYHWNIQDNSYVLVSHVGAQSGEDTQKGELCYQKPIAAEVMAAEHEFREILDEELSSDSEDIVARSSLGEESNANLQNALEGSLERKGPVRRRRERRRRSRRRRSRRRRSRRRRSSECKLFTGGLIESGVIGHSTDHCAKWDFKQGMQSVIFQSAALWRQELSAAPVSCGPGAILQDLELKATGWVYKCAQAAGLGACMPSFGDNYDITDIQDMSMLQKTHITCPDSGFVNEFNFEFSEDGNWMRWGALCCKAGGAPTVIAMVDKVADQTLLAVPKRGAVPQDGLKMAMVAEEQNGNKVEDPVSKVSFGRLDIGEFAGVAAWDLTSRALTVVDGTPVALTEEFTQCYWLKWTSSNSDMRVLAGTGVRAVAMVPADSNSLEVAGATGAVDTGEIVNPNHWSFVCVVNSGSLGTASTYVSLDSVNLPLVKSSTASTAGMQLNMWNIQNVEAITTPSGSGFMKRVDRVKDNPPAYDASVVTESAYITKVSVTMGVMDSRHRRVGLTSSKDDGESYTAGAFIGLFPSGAVNLDGSSSSTWAPGDVFDMKIEGTEINAYKNGAKIGSWTRQPGTEMYAKVWFYEEGAAVASMTVAETVPRALTVSAIGNPLRRKGPGLVASIFHWARALDTAELRQVMDVTTPGAIKAAYAVAAAGDPGCSVDVREYVCIKAADELKAEYKGNVRDRLQPAGCFLTETSSKAEVYFNADRGSGNVNSKPICTDAFVRGEYYPTSLDDTGRYVYKFGGYELKMDNQTGKWCVGELGCSHLAGSVTPAGSTMHGAQPLEVTEITDFDGQFDGSGVHIEKPKTDKKPMEIKLPALPKPPKIQKPELANYDFKKTKYEGSCKSKETGKIGTGDDAVDLWDELEYAEDVKPYKMEFDKKDAPLNSPCAVVQAMTPPKSADLKHSFDKGMLSGGEKMSYTEINDCNNRDIALGFDGIKDDHLQWWYDTGMDKVSGALDTMCGFVPKVNIDPFGFGITSDLSDICENWGTTILAGIDVPIQMFKMTRDFLDATDGNTDCDPLQTGTARVFCDVYCMRDAVIRGDATINHNLEEASTVIQKNMETLGKWTQKTTSAQAGYSVKVDSIHTQYLAGLIKQVYDILPASASLADIESHSDMLLDEMAQFAKKSASDVLSRTTADKALADFVASTEQFGDVLPNTTKANMFFDKVSTLHSVLKLAGDHSSKDAANSIVKYNVKDMQKAIRRSINTLGVYQAQTMTSKKMVRSWSVQRVASVDSLLELDTLWWRLRAKMDAFLDEDEKHLKAYERSLAALENYQQCSIGFSSLKPAWENSVRAREASHQHLRTTWTEVSNLMGEIAAIIADGDMVRTFIDDEGCKSPLAHQTARQAQLALGGLRFLATRFKAGGLGQPDLGAADEASKRLQSAIASATAGCPEE